MLRIPTLDEQIVEDVFLDEMPKNFEKCYDYSLWMLRGTRGCFYCNHCEKRTVREGVCAYPSGFFSPDRKTNPPKSLSTKVSKISGRLYLLVERCMLCGSQEVTWHKKAVTPVEKLGSYKQVGPEKCEHCGSERYVGKDDVVKRPRYFPRLYGDDETERNNIQISRMPPEEFRGQETCEKCKFERGPVGYSEKWHYERRLKRFKRRAGFDDLSEYKRSCKTKSLYCPSCEKRTSHTYQRERYERGNAFKHEPSERHPARATCLNCLRRRIVDNDELVSTNRRSRAEDNGCMVLLLAMPLIYVFYLLC